MRDQELIGLYEAYKEVHRPTETTEELEYDTQSSYQDWVNQLVEEGYDLSNWTDEGLYELYYNEERASGVKEYRGGGYSLRKEVRKSDEVKPAGKKPEGETSGYGQVRPDGKDPLNTPAKDELNFANALAPKPKAFPRIFGKLAPDNTRNSEITKKMGKPKPKAPVRRTINADFEMWVDGLLNEGYDLSNWTSMGLYEYYEQLCEESVEIGQSPTPGGITPKRTSSSLPDAARSALAAAQTLINRTPRDRKLTPIESYKESYDIILSHLLDEGYADTVENAESIMVNMSEDWRESICEANRGDEYATRGMSPDDALKYKQERRNNEFVSNKPKPMRNYYGGHSSSELNSMRQENKPKKKSLPTSAGYDPKTGKRDINKIPMGKYENMLDKKRNPERHKGY